MGVGVVDSVVANARVHWTSPPTAPSPLVSPPLLIIIIRILVVVRRWWWKWTFSLPRQRLVFLGTRCSACGCRPAAAGWSPLAGVLTQAIHTWTPTNNPTMVWRVSRPPLCKAWRARRGRGVPDEFGQRLLGGHHERFVGFTCEHGVGDCCPICPHTMGRTKNHQAETNPVRLCRPCLCCQRLACCP